MEGGSYYRFGDNTVFTRGFTWAWSIIPRSEVVYNVCLECNAVERYPSGAFDVKVEGGTKYPDILGCGSYPLLIVSEKVVNTWHEASITCFHTFPVGITEVKSKKLREVTPPPYFRVEIDGRCQIDLTASGVEVVQYCPKCHHFMTRPMLIPGFRMVPDSWDGNPLFRDPDLFPRVSFCTELVLDLAREHKLTNFRFEPMEGPYQVGSKGIDYMKAKRKT